MIEEAPGSTTFSQSRGARADTFDTRSCSKPRRYIYISISRLGAGWALRLPYIYFGYNSHQAHQANLKLIRPAGLQIYNMSHIVFQKLSLMNSVLAHTEVFLANCIVFSFFLICSGGLILFAKQIVNYFRQSNLPLSSLSLMRM